MHGGGAQGQAGQAGDGVAGAGLGGVFRHVGRALAVDGGVGAAFAAGAQQQGAALQAQGAELLAEFTFQAAVVGQAVEGEGAGIGRRG